MDWRRLPEDSKLHSLIFYRVAEANPEMGMDELYDSTSRFVQEFDIYIGSQSATVQYGVIDGEVMSLFAHGACALLAHQLSKRTELPIALWTSSEEDGGWAGHAALLIGPETVLDIRGVHSFDEVASYYSRYGAALSEPQTVSADGMLSVVASTDEYRENPMSFVDELEQLLIDGYVSDLIEKHL